MCSIFFSNVLILISEMEPVHSVSAAAANSGEPKRALMALLTEAFLSVRVAHAAEEKCYAGESRRNYIIGCSAAREGCCCVCLIGNRLGSC